MPRIDADLIAQRSVDRGAPAIAVDGLTRVFGERTVVDRVDLGVESGELFALLGPNGAGKTTTIRMLCCLLRPTEGTARIVGHDVVSEPLAVKRTIAVVPQQTAVAERLTARENMSLMARLHGVDGAVWRRRADELLAVVGLTARADEPTRSYSGGMKRRLSIAMALVTDPAVLFLDEPTIGLDPQSRRGMWEEIRELKASTTILLTTHYLEEADALADRIAIIDAGRIVAAGTPAELKASIGGAPVTLVRTADTSEAALAALRSIYPDSTMTADGFEIRTATVDLYALADLLRPLGVRIEATETSRVTLDDVFLELTGKELRP